MTDPFRPSLEHLVQEFLSKPSYRPLKQHELARAMGLGGEERSELRRTLKSLESSGAAVCLRGNRWGIPGQDRTVNGILQVNPRGFGFLVSETPGVEDVFIPKTQLGVGLDGDRVQVALERRKEKPEQNRKGDRKRGRRERRSQRPATSGEESRSVTGRVIKILERRTSVVVGLLVKSPYYSYIIPDNPRLPQDVRVVKGETPLSVPEGHKVVVRLHPWDDPGKVLRGEIIEDLGEADQPGVDVLSIMRGYQLTEDFPRDCVTEAEKIAPEPPAIEGNRQDLRGLLTFTIDPEDAKDFDDAVSLQSLENGHFLLGVHIADVSHFVRPGTKVDREALYRGTSVYLVDRVITMLPRFLTANVCSLLPDEDRATHTAMIELSPEGEMLHFETFPSLIHSRQRLTYDEVQKAFDSGEPGSIRPEVWEDLKKMRGLARALRFRRMKDGSAEGSLDLDLPEVRCYLDANGRAVGFRLRGATEAYNLIEEFMLCANRAVATILNRAGIPAVYRIHEEPDEEQWGQMAEDLLALGINKPVFSREQVRKMAIEAKTSPIRSAILLAMLRNFKRAVYSGINKGHFGLGFDLYTHFTSPIRRYPDLLVHRILKDVELKQRTPYSKSELEQMARHCSEAQEKADEAQHQSLESKRIDFYLRQLSEGSNEVMRARIIGLKPRGMLVELEDTLQRGFVSFASMRDDFYAVAEDRSRAVGRKHKRAYKPGQSISVELHQIDPARKMVDFQLAEQASG